MTQASQRPLVIKLGGAGAAERTATRVLAREVRSLVRAGTPVTIVHGGGKQLTALTDRLGLPSRMVAGRRVTCDGGIDAAKMVFAGLIGTELAAVFHAESTPAVHLSGVAGGTLRVARRPPQTVRHADGTTEVVDYGWVGDVTDVEPAALVALMSAGIVPLVASLGVDDAGAIYNVNADTVAAALAARLEARLVLLTDVGGVYRDVGDADSRYAALSVADVDRLLTDGTATGGMLPKLTAVKHALALGAASVHVAAWRGLAPVTQALAGHGATVITG